MEVPVARVEDVPDAERVGRDDALDAPEDLGEPRARDDAVHHHVRGRHAPVGAERELPALPQELALGLGLGEPHVPRPGLAARGDDVGGLVVEPGLEPVQLDEERGRRVARVARRRRRPRRPGS